MLFGMSSNHLRQPAQEPLMKTRLQTQKQRSKKRISATLSRLLARNIRLLQPLIAKWLNESIAQIGRDISEGFAKDKAADITSVLSYWEEIEGNGVRAIKPAVLTIIGNGAQQAYKIADVTATFDVLNVEAVKLADKICAKLVREVTDETKAGIKTFIREGIKEGKSVPKIGQELRGLVGLTEGQITAVGNYRDKLLAKHPDWTSSKVDKEVKLKELQLHRYRTENISRTETSRAMHQGYTLGLKDTGVEEVEFLASPGACDLCLGLNGKKYKIDEAQSIIPDGTHPQCECCVIPVVKI